jgi:DNA-binding MarR family transcriptional regulator
MEPENARIGAAWRQLRRGAILELRQLMYGGPEGTEPLDVALGDALDVIVENEPIRMGDLAAALRVDASTATRTVARLIDAGLARRSEGADRRVVEVVTTPAGQRRHEAMVASATEALEQILSVFDGRERAQLADLLDRMVASLDEVVAERRRRPPT